MNETGSKNSPSLQPENHQSCSSSSSNVSQTTSSVSVTAVMQPSQIQTQSAQLLWTCTSNEVAAAAPMQQQSQTQQQAQQQVQQAHHAQNMSQGGPTQTALTHPGLPPASPMPQQVREQWTWKTDEQGNATPMCVQVIQQPLQGPYLSQLYNTQGQLLMPGNIALQPAGMNSPIQVITAGKAALPSQLPPGTHMLATTTGPAGKQMIQPAHPSASASYSIPTTCANQTLVISPLGVISSQPNILPNSSVTCTVAKPGELSKAFGAAHLSQGITWATSPQALQTSQAFLAQNPIFIRSSQQEGMYVQGATAQATIQAGPANAIQNQGVSVQQVNKQRQGMETMTMTANIQPKPASRGFLLPSSSSHKRPASSVSTQTLASANVPQGQKSHVKARSRPSNRNCPSPKVPIKEESNAKQIPVLGSPVNVLHVNSKANPSSSQQMQQQSVHVPHMSSLIPASPLVTPKVQVAPLESMQEKMGSALTVNSRPQITFAVPSSPVVSVTVSSAGSSNLTLNSNSMLRAGIARSPSPASSNAAGSFSESPLPGKTSSSVVLMKSHNSLSAAAGDGSENDQVCKANPACLSTSDVSHLNGEQPFDYDPKKTNSFPRMENLELSTDIVSTNSDVARSDKSPQKAWVKPHVLTHVIDGYVIQEGSEPFSSSRTGNDHKSLRSGSLTNDSQLASEAKEPPAKKANVAGSINEGKSPVKPKEAFRCEWCGKMKNKMRMKQSKKFCNNTCAKKFTASNPSNMAKEEEWTDKKEMTPSPVAIMDADKKDRFWNQEMMEQHAGESGRLLEAAPETNGTDTPFDAYQPKINPLKWSVSEVCDFVRSIPGCNEYAEDFVLQEIDGQALVLLKEDHLMSAMSMKLGPALKICAKIDTIRGDGKAQ